MPKITRRQNTPTRYGAGASGVIKMLSQKLLHKNAKKVLKKAAKSFKKAKPYAKKTPKIIAPTVNGEWTRSLLVTKYKPCKGYNTMKNIINPGGVEDILTTTLLWGAGANDSKNQLVAVIYEQLGRSYGGTQIGAITDLIIRGAGSVANQFNTQTGNYVRKILYDYITYETSFTNNTPSCVKLTLYDCMAKTTAETTSASADTRACWITGLGDESGFVGAANAYFPGSVPTNSKYFNMKWKIIKKTVIQLGPGMTHYHKKHFAPKRLLDLEYVNKEISIKGLTTELLVVAEGMPTTSVTGLAQGPIALADMKLLVVQKIKCGIRVGGVFQAIKQQITNYLAGAPTHEYVEDTELPQTLDLKGTTAAATLIQGAIA